MQKIKFHVFGLVLCLFGLAMWPAQSHAFRGSESISGYQKGYPDSMEIGAKFIFDPADVGKPYQVFSLLYLEGGTLVLMPDGTFQPLAGEPRPAIQGTVTTSESSHILLRNLPILDYPSFTLYVGYGRDWAEMLSARRYAQVYPAQLNDGEFLPSLPAPLTPQAQQDANSLLTHLQKRMAKYDPVSPIDSVNPDFLRAAALYDAVIRTTVNQLDREERILRDAASTGQISLNPGEAVTVPLDRSGSTPPFCGQEIVCTRSSDAETGEPVLTISRTGPVTTPEVTGPMAVPAAAIDLPGLVTLTYPRSMSLKQCMLWARSCTSNTVLQEGALGAGFERLEASVKLQAESMLEQCARYIEGIYRSQASPTYGNGDAALVSGWYLAASRTYYIYCKEVAFFWTYTTGTLFEAQFNIDGGTTRPAKVASAMTTFADTKRRSIEKLVANAAVGQVPYLNVVNSGIKCLFGTSAVDVLFNFFERSREVNGIACRQTAINLATSVIPILKTIPISATNSRSLTSALGLSLTAIDASQDFYSRSIYVWETSNRRMGISP